MILHHLELIVRTLLQGHILHHEGITAIFGECHIVSSILRIPLVSQEATGNGPGCFRNNGYITRLLGGYVDSLCLGIEGNGHGIDSGLIHVEHIVLAWVSFIPCMILHHLELIVRTLLKGNILHHEGIATIFAEWHIVGGILRIPLVSQEVTSHGPSSLRSRRSGHHLLN